MNAFIISSSNRHPFWFHLFKYFCNFNVMDNVVISQLCPFFCNIDKHNYLLGMLTLVLINMSCANLIDNGHITMLNYCTLLSMDCIFVTS
jgi:hypothetical protein